MGKDAIKSQTSYGILLLAMAPYLGPWLAQQGLTLADVQGALEGAQAASTVLLQVVGGLWAAWGRARANQPITSVLGVKFGGAP